MRLRCAQQASPSPSASAASAAAATSPAEHSQRPSTPAGRRPERRRGPAPAAAAPWRRHARARALLERDARQRSAHVGRVLRDAVAAQAQEEAALRRVAELAESAREAKGARVSAQWAELSQSAEWREAAAGAGEEQAAMRRRRGLRLGCRLLRHSVLQACQVCFGCSPGRDQLPAAATAAAPHAALCSRQCRCWQATSQ
jgi:hypothetical protein